ncbi:MAG: phage integrase central domain-containing protein [Gammaproteobacteria bacterium]
MVWREWHAKRARLWAAAHADKIVRRLERDPFPWIGGWPVGEANPETPSASPRTRARVRSPPLPRFPFPRYILGNTTETWCVATS